MNTYDVIDKTTRALVYQYRAATPVEWAGMEFSRFDHVLQAQLVIAVVTPTVFSGRRILTKLEFRSLLVQAEQEGADEFEATFETQVFPVDVKRRIRTNLKKYEEATFISLDDPATAMGLGLYASLGILAPSRITEVLNG